MREDLAAVNVTRSYTLAGTNLAIFTYMLFFLYPRIVSENESHQSATDLLRLTETRASIQSLMSAITTSLSISFSKS